MKNYVQDGDTIVVAAPAAVSSGDGVLVGSIFGVAVTDAESGADVPIKTRGVFDLNKTASQAWTQGAAIYWDSADAEATNVAEDNLLIGVAVSAVGSGAEETIGRVRLNGSFGHPVTNDNA